MKKYILTLLIVFMSFSSNGQNVKIVTSDIDNFWMAYDCVMAFLLKSKYNGTEKLN